MMKKKRTQGGRSHPKRQAHFCPDAERFFDWCMWNFRPCVEKLDAADKKELASGNMPKKLLAAVCAAWSSELKQRGPLEGACAVAAKVLKNPRELAAWENCLYGQAHKLPKKIRVAVLNALKKWGEENHAAFFAKDGEARLANYLVGPEKLFQRRVAGMRGVGLTMSRRRN